MTVCVNIPPMNHPHRVVALIYNNLCLFEFGIASEIFGLPRPELDVEWYDFQVCSVTPEACEALGGTTVTANKTLKLLDTADTIVLPGWTQGEPPPQLVKKLQNAHARGARLISICSGAFLLGRAGLLDGRSATTHWHNVGKLQAEFPEAHVVPDVLYVDDGQILTSAGSAAGIDLGLHIIRKDYGAAVANSVAKRLVLPAHRSGGQSQFIPKPIARERTSLSPLLDWILEHLNVAHTVSSLAQRANCSERSLLRRFRATTNQSPMQWIIEQRVNRAKELLENANITIGDVIELTGFNTPETLRHHFRSLVGVSPSTYRRSFAPAQGIEHDNQNESGALH